MSVPGWMENSAGQKRKRVTDAFASKFPNPSNDFVLACIADENFAHRTTWAANDRQHAFNEGRRFAWLQIQHTLGLKPDDLEQLAQQTEALRHE